MATFGTGATQRPAKRARGRRALALSTGVLVLLAVTGTVTAIVLARQGADPTPVAAPTSPVAETPALQRVAAVSHLRVNPTELARIGVDSGSQVKATSARGSAETSTRNLSSAARPMRRRPFVTSPSFTTGSRIGVVSQATYVV